MNPQKQKIIPVVASGIIIIGCFLPWHQLGIFFQERGVDKIDGAIILLAGIIAGVVGIHDFSKDSSQNYWVFILVGIVGIITVSLDIGELASRAKEYVNGVERVKFDNLSVTDFIGSGLYLVLAGSVGLALSGLLSFKSEKKYSEVTIEEKIIGITAPKYVKEVELSEEEVENEKFRVQLRVIHEIISKEKRKFFSGGTSEELLATIDSICRTQKDARYLLKIYEDLYRKDLIRDLKKLNGSFSGMKNNLSKFIELKIVEDKYPHFYI